MDGFLDPLFKSYEFSKIFLFANIILHVMVALMASRSGISENEVMNFGVLQGALVAKGETYRLLTAVFLHFGIIHLLFNCFYLFQVGPNVEHIYGTEKFIIIYVVAGLAGNVASFFFLHEMVRSVGASGALYGLIGTYVAFGLRSRQKDVTKRAVGFAITMFLIGLFIGPGINHYAHLFGFLGGLGMAYFLGYGEESQSFAKKRAIRFCATVMILLIPLSFIIAVSRGFE